MYYLQEYECSTRQWVRYAKLEFESRLEALECRDQLIADCPNDGVEYGYRAVDDDAEIQEYTTQDDN